MGGGLATLDYNHNKKQLAPTSKIKEKHTFHLHTSLTRGPNDAQPRESQQPDANNGTGTNQQRQTEKHRGDHRVIQIEEAQVMPNPFGDQAGDLLDVERLLLADAEEYRGGA